MSKRRKLIVALGASALAVPARSIAQQDRKVWRVGYPPFAPPLSFLPGASPADFRSFDASAGQGAMIDLCIAIAKDAGFQFLVFVVGELNAALSSGKIDIRIIAANDDTSIVDVSEPIFNDSDVLVSGGSPGAPYTSYADLKGLVVGVRTNSATERALKEGGFDMRSFATQPELLQAVDSGAVKVAINNGYVPTAFALQSGQYPNVQIVRSYRPQRSRLVGIGVRKDEPALLHAINSSLAKLKAAGTVSTIFARYGIADALIK